MVELIPGHPTHRERLHALVFFPRLVEVVEGDVKFSQHDGRTARRVQEVEKEVHALVGVEIDLRECTIDLVALAAVRDVVAECRDSQVKDCAVRPFSDRFNVHAGFTGCVWARAAEVVVCQSRLGKVKDRSICRWATQISVSAGASRQRYAWRWIDGALGTASAAAPSASHHPRARFSGAEAVAWEQLWR